MTFAITGLGNKYPPKLGFIYQNGLFKNLMGVGVGNLHVFELFFLIAWDFLRIFKWFIN
jgi:hypothetical protein